MHAKLIHSTANPETLIERCGRCCYSSFDKTTATSAIPFIRGLIAAGHESVIEHSRFIFEIETDAGNIADLMIAAPQLAVSRKVITETMPKFGWLVSGNARSWRQAWDVLPREIQIALHDQAPALFGVASICHEYDVDPHQTIDQTAFVELWNIDAPDGLTRDELLKHGAATVFLHDVSRALTHQLVRHRMASYSQMQQRFGKTLEMIECIIPPSIRDMGGAVRR